MIKKNSTLNHPYGKYLRKLKKKIIYVSATGVFALQRKQQFNKKNLVFSRFFCGLLYVFSGGSSRPFFPLCNHGNIAINMS